MKRKTGINLLIAAAGIVAAPILAKEAGLRINTTESAPVGLWIVGGRVDLEHGSLVSICPPDVPVVIAMAASRPLYRGECESGMIPLLKPIAALPGDTVTLRTGNNAQVNGKEIPNTAIRIEAHTLAWPSGTYTVKHGEVWVFSTYSPDSFDSRYFGPVAAASIQGNASPVMVYGSTSDMIRGFQ